ncbi:MAG: transposase [Candidatus Gracilibacteria bacterium]|nr:transposase [Candidatus Gracilibacteria bacterium]
MKFNPDRHNRKSIRLKGYNYTNNGLYFITISINSKLCLLGNIKDGKLELFESGIMIQNEWLNLEKRFENTLGNKYSWGVKLHNFIIMPNHFHGIIEIKNNNSIEAIPCGCPDIIGGFKSITTNKYIEMVYSGKAETFNKKLWQRNYYEHIIKNEERYNLIDNYIKTNVHKWNEDKFYYTEI